jgi:hypothetical protein
MPKKRVTKKNPVKKPSHVSKNILHKPITNTEHIKEEKITKVKTPQTFNLEKVLLENFVSLQRIMTNLTIKIDGLSNQISQLLNLFEVSARTLAEKGNISQAGILDKKILEKIDNVIDQNQTIARGVFLLHEKPQQSISPKQPIYGEDAINKNPKENINEYQKSISSKPQPFNLSKKI